MEAVVGAFSTGAGSALTIGRELAQTVANVAVKIKNVVAAFFSRQAAWVIRIGLFGLAVFDEGAVTRMALRHFGQITFNPSRANRSIQRLQEVGGLRHTVDAIDGLAKLDCMLLRFSALEETVRQHGGVIQRKLIDGSEHMIDVIRPMDSTSPTPEWQKYCDNVLGKMGWPRKNIEINRVKTEVAILRRYRSEDALDEPIKPGCFLRCDSPGMAYVFDRKYIGRHLALGQDVCMFDPRGVFYSTGTPTEGGRYLDTESIYQKLTQEWGYAPESIWATGFCGGGALAAIVKVQHHDEGVNLIVENTINNLVRSAEWSGRFMNLCAKLGLHHIKSTDPETIAEMKRLGIKEDYLDTVEKLQRLRGKKGRVIVISTSNDRTVPPEAASDIMREATKVSEATHLVHHGKEGTNAHLDRPLEDPAVWRRYVKLIT